MSKSEKYSLDIHNAIMARNFFRKVGYGYMAKLADECIEEINLEYTREMQKPKKELNNA